MSIKWRELRGTVREHFHVPSQATAGTADVWTMLVALYDLEVLAVRFVPDAAITADATDYSVYTVTNEGTDGTGTNDVATRSWAATNSVAQVPDTLTLGSATDVLVSAGEVVSVVKTVGGTGLTIPDGRLVVDYRFTGV